MSLQLAPGAWATAGGVVILGGGGGGGAGGDVVGPGSATDNAVARYDGATGKLLKNSVLVVTDAGAVSGATTYNGVTVETHASRHQNGGADEISVAGLSGLLADGQTPLSHASTHEDGGADEITIENLATSEADTTKILQSDGAGGLVWNAAAGGGGTELDANATSENLSCSRTNQTPTVDASYAGQVNLGSESVASKGTAADYATICGGLNGVVLANYSSIVGGVNHSINGVNAIYGSYHFIGGGSTNAITKDGGTFSQNSIVGGSDNTISNTANGAVTRAFIGGGGSNTITSSSASGSCQYTGIVSGYLNEIRNTGTGTGDTDQSFIGAGTVNVIQVNSTAGAAIGLANGIVAGSTNTITNSTEGMIGAGHSNVLNSNAAGKNSWNFIGAGHTNTITTTGTNAASTVYYNSVVAGQSNTISGTGTTGIVTHCGILAGQSNTITAGTGTTASHSVICGGSGHTLTATLRSFIGAGTGNSMVSGVNGSFIGAGDSNTLSNAAADWSVICGGKTNSISSTNASAANAIVGGLNHVISAGNSGFIGSGNTNVISGTAINSTTIVGGGFNTISSGSYSAIVGGASNTITTNNGYCFIGGGNGNNITASGLYSVVAGGENCDIVGSSIAGAIPGGSTCTITDADYAWAAGRRAKANHDGTMVFADSTAADVASVEANQAHFGVTNGVRISHTVEEDGAVIKPGEAATTDATPTTIYTETLSDNSAMLITARVVAMETDGSDRATWIVNALVYRDGGGATVEGSVDAQLSILSAGASSGSWACTIGVSSNDVQVQITGENATNISWRGTILKQQVI